MTAEIAGKPILAPRLATKQDAAAIAQIYNEGIEEHIATCETRLRRLNDVQNWFDDNNHPIVVVEAVENEAAQVLAFASTAPYNYHECYYGIAEFSVYVDRDFRGQGAGRVAMQKLLSVCEEAGFWKLVSRVFVDNWPSRKLLASLGFREVGIHQKHGKVEGVWRDMVLVEKLIEANLK